MDHARQEVPPFGPRLRDQDHVGALEITLEISGSVREQHGRRERPELLSPLDGPVDDLPDLGPPGIGEDAPVPQRARPELRAALEPGDDLAVREQAGRALDVVLVLREDQLLLLDPLQGREAGRQPLPIDPAVEREQGVEVGAGQQPVLHGSRGMEIAMEELQNRLAAPRDAHRAGRSLSLEDRQERPSITLTSSPRPSIRQAMDPVQPETPRLS